MEFSSNQLGRVRVPQAGDKVYKEECLFSFDNPETKTGLYICLNTFLGFGIDYVEQYQKSSGNTLFFHVKRIKHEVPENKDAVSQPKKLAIGIEGGFAADSEKKYEIEEQNSLVTLPGFKSIPLPCESLPNEIQNSIAGIIGADSVSRLEELESLASTWDGEKRVISKHAHNLVQLDNGIKIPPSGWKCERCDKIDNLWLNLTDGSILCGRKFFDGSGGNNHAVEHYNEVHHPLAVKLGTITPNGADVFSYDEDDMVENPNLAVHLAHFGINITAMEKTDKSMIELEIDMNQRIGEWATIQESGSKLVPVYGPGLTGLSNLGNSCYLNSVMQVIFSLPDFKSRYVDDSFEIFTSCNKDPVNDFNVQLSKLGNGLLSGKYSVKPPVKENGDADEYAPGIKPIMFKRLIGKGHPEFSTKRQQDAQEFFLHFINVLERHTRGIVNPAECLKFQMEERIECSTSNKVKYTNRTEYFLPLQIPLNKAINKAQVEAFNQLKAEKEARKERINPEEVVRAEIPMSALLEAFLNVECVDDFYSSATKKKGQALKSTRLSSFPDFLMIQLKKFTVGDDWVPKKLDVSIDMPEELDLKQLRGQGFQANEEELPEENASEPQIELNMAVVQQLTEMGFPENACKRAVHSTGNQGVEAAMAWVMDHMADADFANEFVIPGSKKSKSSFQPNPEAVATIVAMGFTPEQATKALKATDNNIERAADWIFSHADELDSEVSMEMEQPLPPQTQFRDGNEKYKLVAFISHMGTSTMVGHYVCHILKDGKWIIFNDEKVALSEKPPKNLAYLYLYKRI